MLPRAAADADGVFIGSFCCLHLHLHAKEREGAGLCGPEALVTDRRAPEENLYDIYEPHPSPSTSRIDHDHGRRKSYSYHEIRCTYSPNAISNSHELSHEWIFLLLVPLYVNPARPRRQRRHVSADGHHRPTCRRPPAATIVVGQRHRHRRPSTQTKAVNQS